MTALYYEDWEDYHQMEVPFLIERLVIADRQSAVRGVGPKRPIFSLPFSEFESSEYWWEPIRRNLLSYFGLDAEHDTKKVVTYIHRQSQPYGASLDEQDHLELVEALQKLRGCHVNIVSSRDDETSWSDRLHAIVQSTVHL